MNCRWSVAPPQPSLVAELASALRLSPLLVQCLINRGLKDAAQIASFLEPRLKQLSDPFLLPDMEKAVARLFAAREAGEALVIFGDYDVDGVTSTALLSEVLGRLGWRVSFYLPHRLEEGYGLSQDGLGNCLKQFPVRLILAVDCGSTAVETIAWLRGRGVDTIVLDHHQGTTSPPAAIALVNPHVHGLTGGRFRELCSVGLAFKLAHAVVKRARERGLPGAAEFDLKPFLDLVALGTIADLVPLTGENRILVSTGLERLHQTQRPGLRALREVSRINKRIGVYEVGFQLGPRLNAAGRLEAATQALDLLLATDDSTALTLASALDAHNRERQQIERKIADEVIRCVRAKFNPETDYVIVEGQWPWHVGVVGIVASRVMREFYRPAIIIGGDTVDWRGSGRSIEGFDLAAALRSCTDLLSRQGGHAMAVGLSLPSGNLEPLRQRLNDLARQALAPELLRPVLTVDAEVTLRQVTIQSITELGRLEPLGQSNPQVLLVARSVTHARPPQRLGKDQQHVKMWLRDGSAVHETLWWNCQQAKLPEGRFDVVFCPQLNEFNERTSVQLKLLDWRNAA